jgi:hypothetical protein
MGEKKNDGFLVVEEESKQALSHSWRLSLSDIMRGPNHVGISPHLLQEEREQVERRGGAGAADRGGGRLVNTARPPCLSMTTCPSSATFFFLPHALYCNDADEIYFAGPPAKHGPCCHGT